MARRAPLIPQEILRQALIGLGRVGGRAVASAAKSVLKDGHRIARQVEERFENAQKRIDDMVGGDAEERNE